MKVLTHYLFSTGVSFGLLSLSHAVMSGSIVMALWLSLSINYLIDVLGHISRNGNPTRTPWEPLALWTFMGILVSEEHLFLDSLTEAGVYALKRRIAIAQFNYDNMTLNIGFALLGVLLITVSLS